MVRFLGCDADQQQVAGSEALGGFPLVAVAVVTLDSAGVCGEVLTVLSLMRVKRVRSVQSVESGGILSFVLMLWLELKI